jgi:hypothetical protein
LEIKERTKMMDVWLAMFSDPGRDRFSPEANLAYKRLQGSILQGSIFSESGVSELPTTSGQQAELRLWLTNLISSTTGLRTVNIDLGIEAQIRDIELILPTAILSRNETQFRNLRSQWTGNLRLFGKHIQDTSLVAKYGRYQAKEEFSPAGTAADHYGTAIGGDLQLYLLHWLGIEGHYLSLKGIDRSQQTVVTQSYDALGFIDISLLRLTGGPYWENVVLHDDAGAVKSLNGRGIMAGVQLQF